MRDLEKTMPSLRGQLLLAHPALSDPNFRRSVVLLSEHTREMGAVGVILNRPLEKTLGEVNHDFAAGALGAVPVFSGGPVETDQIILTAWRWNVEEGTFQLYFGIEPGTIEELRREDPLFEVRAYLGYSGWGEGQVESELSENAWLVSPIVEEQMDLERLEPLWRDLLRRTQPDLVFLADAPENPELN